MTAVSIIIVNYNTLHVIKPCIDSIVAQTHDIGSEIIVVDNGSTDGSIELLRSEFPTVRLTLLDKNYGFAEGYNRALAVEKAEYLVLLNSDVEVTPGWLRPLIDFMDGHPEAAACQPKLLAEGERDRFEYAGGSGGFLDRY